MKENETYEETTDLNWQNFCESTLRFALRKWDRDEHIIDILKEAGAGLVPEEEFQNVDGTFKSIKHTVVSDEPEQEKPPESDKEDEDDE